MFDQNSWSVVNRNGDWSVVPAVVQHPEELIASANLINLVKGAADKLERTYPGWLWAIKPDETGGVVDIMCLRISSRFGYTLHTVRLQEDEDYRCVVTAGGEFLERFGFRRVAYSHDEWHRREMVMGQFIPDCSDMAVMRQRNFRTEILQGALKSGAASIATNDSIGAALKARAC